MTGGSTDHSGLVLRGERHVEISIATRRLSAPLRGGPTTGLGLDRERQVCVISLTPVPDVRDRDEYTRMLAGSPALWGRPTGWTPDSELLSVARCSTLASPPFRRNLWTRAGALDRYRRAASCGLGCRWATRLIKSGPWPASSDTALCGADHA
jgi:hypothetical protein